jgi:DNA-binding NarL/FixJ family response regulator
VTGPANLTPREREVLVLRAHGLTLAEVADRLGSSLSTASAQEHSAFLRLGVDCLVDALRAMGWLTPPELRPADEIQREATPQRTAGKV